MAGRHSKAAVDAPVGLPEFSLVVKHPGRRGPIAPYRLAICVLVVGVVFGVPLYSTLVGSTPDDTVLLRAAAIGVLVWITTGIVDAALAAASNPVRSAPSSPDDT